VILIISLIVIYDKFIKPTFENCFEQQPHEEPQPNQNIYIFLDKKEIEEEQEETEEQEEQEKNPEDEFVEIDCEEKTVEYNGLNRNRQIEIGYEFPRLDAGENDIFINSGTCEIQIKSKDRWL